MEFKHVSVLLHESIEGLNIDPDGIYFDCTLGGGGHSEKILKKLSPKGRLIGIDQDADAIEAASKRLEKYDNFSCVKSNFSNIGSVAESLRVLPGEINGFMLDLGVSSHQFDDSGRGFSYHGNAPLDMRMDVAAPLSAADVVNTYSKEELTRIIKEYGEENWAARIADFIVAQRKEKPILTTEELVEVIKKAVPKGARRDGPHPARRTFQAIRIEVNNELGIIEDSLNTMASLLKKGGRICVITFHSLEDRIVKNTFKKLQDPCICPREFPVCMCGRESSVKIITKKPIIPSQSEIEANNRARSAKLRIVEKII